eukprot:s1773_g7.t1
MRPLRVDPNTGETPEEQELARATQAFLAALAAVDAAQPHIVAVPEALEDDTPEDAPGVVSAENYQPPDEGEGSGPSEDEGTSDDPGVPRFNAFGNDSAGW